MRATPALGCVAVLAMALSLVPVAVPDDLPILAGLPGSPTAGSPSPPEPAEPLSTDPPGTTELQRPVPTAPPPRPAPGPVPSPRPLEAPSDPDRLGDWILDLPDPDFARLAETDLLDRSVAAVLDRADDADASIRAQILLSRLADRLRRSPASLSARRVP